jgi:RNA-directed DNA polymerase
VVDAWLETVVKAHCRGQVVLYRYADDFLIGCELERDARRIEEVLPKRFAKYGLEINPEKTKLVNFRHPRRGPDSRQPGAIALFPEFRLLRNWHFSEVNQ